MAEYYSYRARTADNQLVTGRVQAADMDAARKLLQKNRLIPISLSVPRNWQDYLPFANRVSLKEKSLFARQLATMIEAGLTLSQALRLLVRQQKKGSKLQGILVGVLSDIQDGFSFSTALAKFPEVFDPIFLNVVRSGEATGKLDSVLKELAFNLEKEVGVRNKIRGALMYPAFILVVMLVVMVIMAVSVIPQLSDVFASSGQQLPGSTKLLIFISDSLINFWYLYIAVIAAVAFGVRAFIKTENGQELVSHLSLKVPVMGKLVEQSSMARFGRLLGLLLASGVPLLEGLRLMEASFTNNVQRDAVAQVAASVERGVPMSTLINKLPVFPPMVGQMVSVGEQTGKMDEVMVKMAGYFESEVDAQIGGLSSLIEPIVIVVLGVGVAWLVQSILMPIYAISTAI